MKISSLVFTLPLLGALFTAPASAAYRMTAFGGTPGFEQIMAQDYATANGILKARSSVYSRYARLANLCVSQLKSNEPEQALEACERAVKVAPADLSSPLSPEFQKRTTVMTHLYSNRGVVRAVTGDTFGARADFERALTLDANNISARRNLEYISSGDLAQQGE